MAKFVLVAAMLLVNAVDYSDHCSKIELSLDVDDKEATTFASLGWKEALPGLKSGKVNLQFKNDMAAANVDANLWALFGTVTTFEVRAVNTARSTSNPAYTGSLIVKSLKPISGSVGDLADFDVDWPVTGAVARQIV